MPINESKDMSWGGVAHGVADVAGFVPGVGDIIDVGHAAVYAAQGDYLNALFSLISAIPAVGSFIGVGGKGVVAALKMPKTAAWFTKWGPKIKQIKGTMKNNESLINQSFAMAAKSPKIAPHLPGIQQAMNSFMSTPDTPQGTATPATPAVVAPPVAPPVAAPAGRTPSPHPTVASRQNWLYKAIACE